MLLVVATARWYEILLFEMLRKRDLKLAFILLLLLLLRLLMLLLRLLMLILL